MQAIVAIVAIAVLTAPSMADPTPPLLTPPPTPTPSAIQPATPPLQVSVSPSSPPPSPWPPGFTWPPTPAPSLDDCAVHNFLSTEVREPQNTLLPGTPYTVVLTGGELGHTTEVRVANMGRASYDVSVEVREAQQGLEIAVEPQHLSLPAVVVPPLPSPTDFIVPSPLPSPWPPGYSWPPTPPPPAYSTPSPPEEKTIRITFRVPAGSKTNDLFKATLLLKTVCQSPTQTSTREEVLPFAVQVGPPFGLPGRTGAAPCPYPTPPPPSPPFSYLPPGSSPPPFFYLHISGGGGSVPLAGQTTATHSIGVMNRGSDTWEVSFSPANMTPGLSVSIDPKTVTVAPNSPGEPSAAGGGPGPAVVGAIDAPPGATLPPSIARAFPFIRSTVLLRITEEPVPGKVYEAVVLARARSGSTEFTEELKFWVMPCPQQATTAPLINSNLAKDLGWVTMTSSTGIREVALEGRKVNLTLFMTTMVKERALTGRVPAVFMLMGIGAPAGASLIDPESVLEALSGNLTGFPLPASLPGPNASPYLSFRETERTTIPVAGGTAKARIYASEFEGTPLKGLLAVWRSGNTLAGVWAIVPENDYPDVLKLIERVEVPQPKASPGFELVLALAALAVAGSLCRRR